MGTTTCIPWVPHFVFHVAITKPIWRRSDIAETETDENVLSQRWTTTRAAEQRLRWSCEREVPTLRAINTEPRFLWTSRKWERNCTNRSALRQTLRRRTLALRRLSWFFRLRLHLIRWIHGKLAEHFCALLIDIFADSAKAETRVCSRGYWLQFNKH